MQMRTAPTMEAPEVSELGNEDSEEVPKGSKRQQHLKNFIAGEPSRGGKKPRRTSPSETRIRPERLCVPPAWTRSYIGRFQAAGEDSPADEKQLQEPVDDDDQRRGARASAWCRDASMDSRDSRDSRDYLENWVTPPFHASRHPWASSHSRELQRPVGSDWTKHSAELHQSSYRTRSDSRDSRDSRGGWGEFPARDDSKASQDGRWTSWQDWTSRWRWRDHASDSQDPVCNAAQAQSSSENWRAWTLGDLFDAGKSLRQLRRRCRMNRTVERFSKRTLTAWRRV